MRIVTLTAPCLVLTACVTPSNDRVADRAFLEKLNTPLGVECFREAVGGTDETPAPPTSRITLTDELSREILDCYEARDGI